MELYTKMLKVVTILLLCGALDYGKSQPSLQDFQNGAILAAAQVKDMIETGAAARDNKEIEFMGFKARNNMEMGFGDAMRPLTSSSEDSSEERRKREINSDNESSSSYSFSSESSESHSLSYSDESDS